MSKARLRRSVVAQEMFDFAVPAHRRGPRRTKDSRVPHGSREEIQHGVAHVTIKLKKRLRSLRRKEERRIVEAAIARVNKGGLVRIVEYSIMGNHVHLIVEASSSADLSKGMASLNTGLGMRLNRLWNRVGQGSIFQDRFHLEVIHSPTQMRNVLMYVLRNDVHHGMGLGKLDPCSSAPSFRGFRERQGHPHKLCVTAKAQTWLLRVGWTKGGIKGLLSAHDHPRRSEALRA